MVPSDPSASPPPPSKAWTLSPPAPLLIKDRQVFDRRAPSLSVSLQAENWHWCVVFWDVFVSSCYRNPFSPLFASRLHPVPRHTGISSHLSEQWLKKRAKRLHCYQGCSWTKGPTVKREVILYNNSMWRWGYWLAVQHIMLMLLRERTQWPLRVEYKDERTLLLKAVLGLMKCYLL